MTLKGASAVAATAPQEFRLLNPSVSSTIAAPMRSEGDEVDADRRVSAIAAQGEAQCEDDDGDPQHD